MRSLREFAQFVGKPGEPISALALADYLRDYQPHTTLSLALFIQSYENISAHFALNITAFPARAKVPFTANLGFGPHPGYVFAVTWRILRDGQAVAAYPLVRVPGHIGDDGLFATHQFTEPGTYTVEATAHGIGSTGYAVVTQTVTVVAEPKAPSPPPPPPPTSPPPPPPTSPPPPPPTSPPPPPPTSPPPPPQVFVFCVSSAFQSPRTHHVTATSYAEARKSLDDLLGNPGAGNSWQIGDGPCP